MMSATFAFQPGHGTGLDPRRPRDPVDTMPHMTHQYALPIHQASFRRRSDAIAGSCERTARAETSLRRKTPNGTLHNGYEGAYDDSNPSKHQVVPSSELQQWHVPPSNAKRTFLQHQQQAEAGRERWHNTWGQPKPGIQMSASQNFVPVMDSMLDQVPQHGYGAQPFYGQSGPSVRQPSYQYLGPTAVGLPGSGPYGPYWHDGTFVPYRPAAVRDPRFYHHPSLVWPNPLQSAPGGPSYHVWPRNTSHQAPSASVELLQPSSYSPIAYGNHRSATSPVSSLPPVDDVTPTQSRAHSIDFGHEPAHLFNGGIPDPSRAVDSTQSTGSLFRDDYASESANGQQRDKVFAWALQQYRELLTFIHHTKKQQQQHRLLLGQQHITRLPIFYPKPPKPTLAALPLQSARKLSKPSSEQQADATYRQPRIPLQRADTDPAFADFRNDQQGRSNVNSYLETLQLRNDALFDGFGNQRRASHEQYGGAHAQWPKVLQHPKDKFSTLRRSSGVFAATVPPSVPSDESPPSRASLALSCMTRLCLESDWRWTDGMHLAGCLAYGLGDYSEAMRWYKKVLHMDSKHLEATSNMAATLLALGHRVEAEELWLRVVKAAPNHFEAVEHLVGMLCYDQRSRDAVRVIEHVERALRCTRSAGRVDSADRHSECSASTASRSPCASDRSDKICYDFEADGEDQRLYNGDTFGSGEPGFGSSGFAVSGSDNGRILALIHAKGNMLYGLGDNAEAARAFEDAVLIAAGRQFQDIQGLIKHILHVVSSGLQQHVSHRATSASLPSDPMLLAPEQALMTAKLCFPYSGELPGLRYLPGGPQSFARKAVISTTSNSLLSLAKIFQDGMASTHRSMGVTPLASGVRDILALYYLSLALQPSPSTANNVGILLASVQQVVVPMESQAKIDVPGVLLGSGVHLALLYYNYGLQLDQFHAHLYTNLGSLLKDIGQLDAAIDMYERAVKCDAKFDIALANLANAVKDKGKINEAIVYYRRAVDVNPDFAEAVCGLANALNSVCAWRSRGGIAEDGGKRDKWHVNAGGMVVDGRTAGSESNGWIKRVVDIVEKQLLEGENWGSGTLEAGTVNELLEQLIHLDDTGHRTNERRANLEKTLDHWSAQKWEGARVTRLIERAARRTVWQWYRDVHIEPRSRSASEYNRVTLPAALTIPTTPTVLPFHTFTCPMSAKQVRLISQRNGLRISVSTLRSPWLPKQVYPPPAPPAPCLRVGYVSSDFNNHPLAHLMQSVFGLHNERRVQAHCYATTASDNSVHRRQIEMEAPVFHDASSWSAERLVNQIVKDGIHILVNLNGYTRGARNEVFAARPAPIQMSFMGFAGSLGAEWCDYLLADETAVPPAALRPWRRNVDLEDQLQDENNGGGNDDWIYGENIIFCRETFFCCDHKQSAPDTMEDTLSWEEEQTKRWQMRKELFPNITDDTVIFGNFNQLYKIEPTTFRTWLRILSRVKNSILWLLRFPDIGEPHLLETARLWAGPGVASRVVFTDVAPKHLHISRARICDLVLDTAECNAHTTAADVLWSGTPLLTLPRYQYKMCSRMAASILKGALPKTEDGRRAAGELVAISEEDYEEKAIALGATLAYVPGCDGKGRGRLVELRKLLYHARWTSALFDTKRWVSDLEDAYDEAWRRWVVGEGGDIWLDRLKTDGI